MSYYMSNHVEREILSAMIDGELEADQRRAVHEHLQGCAACRETVEEFTQIHGLMGKLPRLVAPESFVSTVLERPRVRPIPLRVASAALTGRRRWFTIGAAAAATAISLAGLLVAPPADEPAVDAFIDRHVSTHSGVEPGAHVLFAVTRR